MSTLRERLIQARKKSGLSQGQTAEKVGISQPTYSDLETGKQLSTGVLPQLAEAFGVDALWLATGRGSPPDLSTAEVDLAEYEVLAAQLSDEQLADAFLEYFRSLPRHKKLKKIKQLLDEFYDEE